MLCTCFFHFFQTWSKLWFQVDEHLPLCLDGKDSPCNAGDLGLIPVLGRFPGEGNSYPLHILAWRIPRTEEPDRTTIHGLQESDMNEQLTLSLFMSTYHIYLAISNIQTISGRKQSASIGISLFSMWLKCHCLPEKVEKMSLLLLLLFLSSKTVKVSSINQEKYMKCIYICKFQFNSLFIDTNSSK